MVRIDSSRRLYLLAAAAAGCSHAPKHAASPEPATLCLRWEVTVNNEFAFPVAVYLYAKGARALLGAASPGFTRLWASDSGQVMFKPPMGQTTIARGRQVTGKLQCVSRDQSEA